MALLISPRTRAETVATITEAFSATRATAAFWHSNFADGFYEAQVGHSTLFILFAGYGELAVAAAVAYEYQRLLRAIDSDPRVFFVGSCINTVQSGLDLNAILVPVRAYSDGTVAQELADRARRERPAADPWALDARLTEAMRAVATARNVTVSTGMVYSKESIFHDFWDGFELEWGYSAGYVVGDYETGAFAAACNLIGVAGSAVLHVVDTKMRGQYEVATSEQKRRTLKDILSIIKMALETA